jgi:hypothetical protein
MYMTIHKRSEWHNFTKQIPRFQYGVKPPSAAIRASMRRDTKSKRAWINSFGIYFHVIYIRVHNALRVVISRVPWKQVTATHIPDMFNGRHVWWNCRSQKHWYRSFFERDLHNPRHILPGIVLLKYGMWSLLKEGQYSGSKTSLI